MILQSDKLGIEGLLRALAASKEGFVLLQGKPGGFLDVLARGHIHEAITLMGKEGCQRVLVFPIRYVHHDEQQEDMGNALARQAAIRCLYLRWKAGHPAHHRSKSPFADQAFLNYIRQIDLLHADHLVVLYDKAVNSR